MEDQKIKIEICCGTACYMLGAAELLRLENILPDQWKDSVDISAIPCLEACSSDNLGGAPFVKINGELMSNASVESVCEKIFEIMKTRGGH